MSISIAQAEIYDCNPETIYLTHDSSILIRYHSNAHVTLNYSISDDASLSSYKVTNGDRELTTNPAIFEHVESDTFTFTITDSLGNVATYQDGRGFIPYKKLSCLLSEVKLDGEGNLSFRLYGNYYSGTFGYRSNYLGAHFRYKVQGGTFSDWIGIDTEISDSAPEFAYYTANVQVGGLDYKLTYVVQVEVWDQLESITLPDYVVTGKPVFDWSKDDFNFNVPVQISGDVKCLSIGRVDLRNYGDDYEVLSIEGGNGATGAILTGLIKPRTDQDAANKAYVDTGLSSKQNIATYYYPGGPYATEVAAWLDSILSTMPDRGAVTVSGYFYDTGASHIAYGILYRHTYDWASLYTTSYVDEEWRIQKYEGVWQSPEYITRATKADVDSLRTDYIVAQGVIKGWTWLKRSSGIAECWKNNIEVDGIDIPVGNFTTTSIALPFSFIDTDQNYQISLDSVVSNSNLTVGVPWKAHDTAIVRVINNGASVAESIKFDLHITGRWKY